MRIVYDDAKQGRFVAELLPDFLRFFSRGSKELKSIIKYDYGMDRVQAHLFKQNLNTYLKKFDYEVGNDVIHKNGIGNNCRYPVYYTNNPDELQICCYININKGLHSEIYINCENFNGERKGVCYEINKLGVHLV